MKAAALVDVPQCFKTAAFIAERNAWYRRLEREGHDVDELGYKQSRERARKGPARGDPERYGQPTEDSCAAERVNHRRMGGRSVWGLDTAEYWQLISAEVEKLGDVYDGKAFLRRWAEIGDVKTAAQDTGITRWAARRHVAKFMVWLKRKRVLR